MKHYLSTETYVLELTYGIRIVWEGKQVFLTNYEVEKLKKYLNGKPKDDYMEKAMEMTHYQCLEPVQVQFILDSKQPGDFVNVIFLKKDGTQRQIKGQIIPSEGPKKTAVPIDTPEGIKSFCIDRVLFIS